MLSCPMMNLAKFSFLLGKCQALLASSPLLMVLMLSLKRLQTRAAAQLKLRHQGQGETLPAACQLQQTFLRLPYWLLIHLRHQGQHLLGAAPVHQPLDLLWLYLLAVLDGAPSWALCQFCLSWRQTCIHLAYSCAHDILLGVFPCNLCTPKLQALCLGTCRHL